MAGAVVVERGGELFVVRSPPGRVVGYRRGPDPGSSDELLPDHFPPGLLEALHSLPGEARLAADSEPLAERLAGPLRRTVTLAELPELRTARAALPRWEPAAARRWLLEAGRVALERALRTPEEVLITLTREEERV